MYSNSTGVCVQVATLPDNLPHVSPVESLWWVELPPVTFVPNVEHDDISLLACIVVIEDL